MQVTGIENAAFDPRTLLADPEDLVPVAAVIIDEQELRFELGLWLAGLESFLTTGYHTFFDTQSKEAGRDWTKEFRLTHSTLLLCTDLLHKLEKTEAERSISRSFRESQELFLILRDAVVLNEAIIRSAPLSFGEWKAWSGSLAERIRRSSAFVELAREADNMGAQYLPPAFRKLLAKHKVSFTRHADFFILLPYFAKVLKSLSLVERMLKSDEPLKPALIIFSRIFEQSHELINHMKNRLARLADEEAELFKSLDGAAYSASIEMKKVYNQELTGVIALRSSPGIYARIETAHALISDSFQHILAGFAHLIDPKAEPSALFPNFRSKFDRSIVLRDELERILESVKTAEQDPEKETLKKMNDRLAEFLERTVHFLFFKDKETVERFVEEILITKDNKDLIPILHRFGAYLETLLGLVNMRAVLAEQNGGSR